MVRLLWLLWPIRNHVHIQTEITIWSRTKHTQSNLQLPIRVCSWMFRQCSTLFFMTLVTIAAFIMYSTFWRFVLLSKQGDSGGPLICRQEGYHYLAGVTSWGVSGCQTTGYPSVFTRVAYYTDWVQKVIDTHSKWHVWTAARQTDLYIS